MGVKEPYGIQLLIRMTDREPLEEWIRIFGGKIYGPYGNGQLKDGSGSRKPIFVASITDWATVIDACKAMRPRLSVRRKEQLDKFLAYRPVDPRGMLACRKEPIASTKGFERHRKLGVPPCENCLRSARLYYKLRNDRVAAARREKRVAQGLPPDLRIKHYPVVS